MEVSNSRFTNRRSLSLAVVQATHYQLEPQDYLLHRMSLTHLYHVCGEVHTCISHFRFTLSLDQPKPLPEEDYQFVVQPSKDFFCPVTFGLLLQPHLTPCCGNHFSQEAASMIQEEGGACPLCKANPLHTMLNKHFQRQVKSLRVFCHHDERGCGWQGELANFDSHVQSCPMRDIPLMTELMKLPL